MKKFLIALGVIALLSVATLFYVAMWLLSETIATLNKARTSPARAEKAERRNAELLGYISELEARISKRERETELNFNKDENVTEERSSD